MKRAIWGLLILFFLVFSLAPAAYEVSRMGDVHKNRRFELVHNFYTDYNFYLSRIRQGREGAWTATEKYTSEPHEGSYIQILYVLMGKVSAWIGVPWPHSGDTYHMGRIVLSGTLLFLIAFACKKNVLAFLLAVTAASWPILVFHNQEWRFGGYMPWWTIMDSLQRITFVPHMLAGQALIIFLLVAMTSGETMKRKGNWIFLGCLAFLLGVVFPPGLLFVFVTYGIYILISHNFSFTGPLVIGIISAPALIYLSLMLRVYPWKRLVDFALLHPQPFVLTDYALAVGPVLVLGVVGAVRVVWERKKEYYLWVAWALAWASCILAFQYIPGESPLRFTEMLPQLPLAILGVYFLGKLGKLGGYAIVILVTLGLLQMYSSWRWQKEFVDHKMYATQPLVPTGSYVMYPLKDFYDAMIFVQDNTKRTDIILSETTAGNYLPVYAGNTVYVGHAGTVATEQKEQTVKTFFSGKMTAEEAYALLQQNNIRLVFFGPQEMENGVRDLAAIYPFLVSVYHNTHVYVYAVRP